MTVPTLYISGALDDIIRPSVVKTSFARSANASPRAFVELADADHFEPTNPRPGHMRLNPYAAAFLLCHVSGDDASCSHIYDATDAASLCDAYADQTSPPAGACDIVGGPDAPAR